MTTSDVVSTFGGVNAMAAALGLTHSHVSYWLRVGYIPLKRHDEVLSAASRLRLGVTREALLSQVERASPRPLGGVPTAQARSSEVLALAAVGVASIDIAKRLSISYSSVRRIVRSARP